MTFWPEGYRKVLFGVVYVPMECASCRQQVLVREEHPPDYVQCERCRKSGQVNPRFGGVAYGHRSDSQYHGGYSE